MEKLEIERCFLVNGNIDLENIINNVPKKILALY